MEHAITLANYGHLAVSPHPRERYVRDRNNFK